MFLPDRVVRSHRVITLRGTRPAAVHIRRGRIAGVLEYDEVLPGSPIDDVDGVVMPGVVDTHLHTADIECETRSALAAGVTTIVLAAAGVDERRRVVEGRCAVDVGFWSELRPGNSSPSSQEGALGFHCGRVAEEAMPEIRKLDATLLVHPELPHQWFGRRTTEAGAVTKLIEMTGKHGTRTHVHLSAWEALTPLFFAQQARVPITAETSASRLTRAAGERERKNREYLWAALATGLIRVLVAGGESLGAIWSEARARGYTLEQVVEWMCRAPAQLAGLTRKGKIDAGYDADLVVFDPDRGAIERTYLRGADTADGKALHGRLLSPGAN